MTKAEILYKRRYMRQWRKEHRWDYNQYQRRWIAERRALFYLYNALQLTPSRPCEPIGLQEGNSNG